MIKVMIAALISLMSFAPIMAQNIKGKIENYCCPVKLIMWL